MVGHMEPMHRFHRNQADHQCPHKRTCHRAITQLKVYKIPDADGNGVPDCATVLSGEVSWMEDGGFTAETDATIQFATQVPDDGSYSLYLQTSNPAGILAATINGNLVTLDAATGVCTPFNDHSALSTEIILSVQAGTTVENMTYLINN